MSRKSLEEERHGAVLGEAMRIVRKQRRMRPSEVAVAMGMPVRSYEHFEAGKGRISIDRLTRFAAATNSDATALLAAVVMGSPEFALRCADNKLVEIVMIALGELNEELGDDIVFVEPRTIIGGITRLCKELVDHVRGRDLYAEQWLQERSPRLRGRGRAD